MPKCCYCKNEIVGEPNFCVPEDFPRDPRHEGLPLCDACGGGPLPTLDQICFKLDAERRRRWLRMWIFVLVSAGLLSFAAGGTPGLWGLVVGPAYAVCMILALWRERPSILRDRS